MSTSIAIGIDAMGGDYGALPMVRGAVRAAREFGDTIRLVLAGDAGEIRRILDLHGGYPRNLEIHHARDRVAMGEEPVRAVKKKKDSSLNRLARLQAHGDIAAMISAGNTGAVVASAQLILGKLAGVNKPAIASFIPTIRGSSIVLDVGATVDCRPMDLVQFAVMGSLYASYVLRLTRPRVGLLSIGEESEKGNEVTRSAHRLLRESHLEFIGNLEGRDILQGNADVVVCDGFVGNIVLKYTEGALAFLAGRVRTEVRKNISGKLGAWLLKPALLRIRRSLDPEELGGAPILGLNGVCIVAHGRSSPTAIYNAIKVAVRYVQEGVNEHICTKLTNMPCGSGRTEMEGAPT